MTKDKLTIGHYASHRNTGGYPPTKSNGPKTLNSPKGENGLNLPPEFFHNISIPLPEISELELRIRKEVMDAMEELKSFEDEFEDETEIYFNNLLNKVIDRLKLLWGEDK